MTVIPIAGIGTFTVNWTDFWGMFGLTGIVVAGGFFTVLATMLWDERRKCSR